MFPKKTIMERFRPKSYPSVYGNIDQTFYACLKKPHVTKTDLWKQKKIGEAEIEEPIVGRKDHVYFVINTAVGVGGKDMNKVKIVHIRFRLIPMHPKVSDPEVISIYPHSISERSGLIKISKEMQKELAATAKSPANFWAGLSMNLGKKVKKSKDYALPYYVIVANASGTGNRAIWEVYQDEGMASIGCFDLKIYFRILKEDLPAGWEDYDLIRDRYCVDWNVEVNERRLIDHDIDFYSDWDIMVNGRCSMDKQMTSDRSNEGFEILSNFNDEKEKITLGKNNYYNYWNRKVVKGPQNEKPRKWNRKEKYDPFEHEITYWINEEDPNVEPQKLLLPLYLLPKTVEIRSLSKMLL